MYSLVKNVWFFTDYITPISFDDNMLKIIKTKLKNM